MPSKYQRNTPKVSEPLERGSIASRLGRLREQFRRATFEHRKRYAANRFREHPFRRAAVLLGPPRGGTTIVSRCIGQHSRVQNVIEPYHRRREENYLEADPVLLSADFGLRPDPDGCLLVKETFTRSDNVDTALQLLVNLDRQGAASTLIYVCRSPIAGFSSQVKASQNKWARQNTFSYSVESLRGYLHSIVRNSLCTIFQPLPYQRLLVFYERFCTQPEVELQRVMKALGMSYEAGQLALDNPSNIRGGDPGARLRTRVEAIDDQAAAERMREELGHTTLGVSALELHDVVQRLSHLEVAQDEAIRQLREAMQTVSERHFPVLHARFLEFPPEQGAGA